MSEKPKCTICKKMLKKYKIERTQPKLCTPCGVVVNSYVQRALRRVRK